MNRLHFNSLPSTYTYIAENAAGMVTGAVVTADYQTAGRGQRGNTWESDAGENLLFSMLARLPQFEARRQFYISEAVSMAIVDTLEGECGVKCKVKWPNDIYAGDKKICGILISHAVEAGSQQGVALITHSVLGAGINLNQREFRSDAPNPVSVWQLTGRQTDREAFLQALVENINTRLEQLDSRDFRSLHDEYMSHLWRADGCEHPFYDVGTGERFMATVYAVEPMGHLILSTSDGLRRYAFKEVSWL